MYPKARNTIALLGIGFALWLGLMGLFISFVPGADAEWFGIAAIFATFGLLSPSWRSRAVAIVLVIGLMWFAWLGYEHGQRYQEWLRQQESLRGTIP